MTFGIPVEHFICSLVNFMELHPWLQLPEHLGNLSSNVLILPTFFLLFLSQGLKSLFRDLPSATLVPRGLYGIAHDLDLSPTAHRNSFWRFRESKQVPEVHTIRRTTGSVGAGLRKTTPLSSGRRQTWHHGSYLILERGNPELPRSPREARERSWPDTGLSQEMERNTVLLAPFEPWI